ncbi:outer membrane receptor protein involved in Fe transport [Sphingopyxis panaciterrae]|uniref:TonB-dependent receptor plug domain-containing protein n=1 Tax=Sphingopyxis panaciterrae TaxID=363841 RepID=UPI00141D9BA9|nr:TonB-dependent receptor [Sphingopyxis panaciterrae]NIJ38136.1 outer membrane receptor protein involved in Fe transport [Sphingopyxis panaciterrae]
MNYRASRALCCMLSLSALLAAAPLSAQTAGNAGVTSYAADFFARSQPTTAYDMVVLLPGFRLQEGNSEVRGYSGSGGNVLIDGQRPASKEETLEAILKRIPARSVDHIELVRSSAAGFDMQGYPVLANIVRAKGGRLSGRLEGEYANFAHGYSAPRVAGTLNFQAGDKVIELQAARYRVIDDEHGFGIRNRYAPDGTPLRLTDYAQPEGTSYTEFSGSYRQPLFGGTLRANGLFKSSQMFADVRHDIYYPADALILATERNNERATEGQLQYSRGLGVRGTVELLAIRRDHRLHGVDTSTEEDLREVNATDTTGSETILRGVIRRQGKLLSLDVGAEGAQNILDSHVALSENGVEVPLPADDVRIEEKRAEFFVTGTWRPATDLSVETGLRYEISRLTQTGDSQLTKSLSYWKPRLLVSYTPTPKDRFRLQIEREVGQLDFEDFVSSPSLTSGTISAGNKNLEPDSLVRYEAAWERRIGDGSVVIAARHEAVSNLVDRIPIFLEDGSAFDSAGNIGSATRDEVELNLNLPLDRIGLTGLTVKGNGLLRRSRVRDPLTGDKRRISGDRPVEADVSLTYDLPQYGLRTGVNYIVRKTETSFKVDEIEEDIDSGRIDAFVEYKPGSRWTLRCFAKNLTNSPTVRRREVYSALRGTSTIDYREVRSLRSGRYFGVNLQWNFGR